MSISSVTIKKGDSKYQWAETDESIIVKLPIKNVALKNIDVFFSDLVLKVNATSIKYLAIVDFKYKIDYLNPKNRVQLIDNKLEVYLMKATPGAKWEQLEVSELTRSQVMARRQKSVDEFHAHEEAERQKSSKAILKQEKEVIDEQMQVERHERKTIKNKKKEELNKA